MKKKIVAGVLAAVMLLAVLTACGKKVPCDFCEDEKKCEPVSFFGEELYICDDCRSVFTGE